jgi:hypothetical protein
MKKNSPPVEGDYLTDGTELYEMTGTDTDGYFYLANCRQPAEEQVAPIKLSQTELSSKGFRIVRPN